VSSKVGQQLSTGNYTVLNRTARELVEALHADAVIIGRLDGSRMRSLSLLIDGEVTDSIEYDIEGTPCGTAIAAKSCSYSNGVQELFPQDVVLKEMGIEAYVGSSLFDSSNVSLGVIAALFRHPIEDAQAKGAVLEVFAARAAAEIERSETEARLLESEHRFRALFYSTADAILLLKDGVFIEGNRSAAEIYGCSLHELIGRSPVDFSPPLQPDGKSSEEKARLFVESALAGEPQRFEWSHNRLDGAEIDTEVSLNSLTYRGEQLVLAIVRDITARKETEKELRLTRQCVDTSAAPLYWIEEDGRFSYVNDAVCRETGYSREELLTLGVDELSERIVARDWSELWERIKSEGSVSFESVHRRKDGTTYPVFVTASHHDHEGHELVYALAMDISWQKNAEDALRESDVKYRQMFDQLLDACVVCKVVENDEGHPVDFRYLGVNRAFENMVSLEASEIIGRNLTESFPETKAMWFEVGTQVSTTGRPSRFSMYSDSLDRYFEAVAFRPMEGRFAVVLKDITERRREEQTRRAVERELAEQRVVQINTDRLRSLGEMATGIAHELNQPLVGVRGLAEHVLIGMERGWEMDEQKLREKLEGIVEQADRMTHIIEHVRLFAREAGKPESQLVSVNEIVASAVSLMGTQLRSRGIEVEVQLAEKLPKVLTNPYSIEEVVLNILVNARDAVEDRLVAEVKLPPPHISVKTFLDPEVDPIAVVISVSDRGIGLDPALSTQVFEPFFTTKEAERGTGLGLSISKSIIDRFGGSMEIGPNSDEGVSVRVALPVLTEPKAGN
jgi:PAS domain S-box-containing protein